MGWWLGQGRGLGGVVVRQREGLGWGSGQTKGGAWVG